MAKAPRARSTGSRGRSSRTSGGRKWIAGAIKHPGAFTAKAKSAGMGTQAYARKVTAKGSTASTTTKRQARLAITLKKIARR